MTAAGAAAQAGSVVATVLHDEGRGSMPVVVSRDAAGFGEDADGAPEIRRAFPGGGGGEAVLHPTPAMLDEGAVDPPCAVCGCEFLYVQRDFNRGLGLGIVVAAAIVGLAWSGMTGTIYPLFFCLVGASLIDLVVYLLVPPVVVCYRCLTCYRGGRVGEGVKEYDQAIADGFAFSGQILGSDYRHERR